MGNTPTVPQPSTDDTVPATTSMGEGSGLPVRDRARYLRSGEIARGGMGRIVAAFDQELGRHVAIKELLNDSAALVQRFDREIRITSRLQHPSIIAVLDAGRWADGDAFYTMPHVDGRALKDAIAEAASLDARIALVPHVIAVADALAYAHGRWVIHRDLKPSNILVGQFGETIVIDWGLAKDLRDAGDEPISASASLAIDGVTVLGQALGTPAYMPPEQARGEAVDARADVYALGAILYHVLAQRPPYADATSASDVVDRVRSGPPRAIDELVPDAPADLRAVVRKAMARDLAVRYPTAAGLAGDLRRFATGQLVGAHRYSPRQLLARWIGRHRAAVAVAAAATVALATLGVVAIQGVREQRDVASSERRVAEGHRTSVEGLLDFMLTDLHGKLEPIGKLELLGMVVDEASAYYASRPIDWTAPEEAKRRGLVHRRLGDVRVARGDLPGGLADYRAAFAIFERLGADRELAAGHTRIGSVLRRQGDLTGALDEFRAALAIFERHAAEDPSDRGRQHHLSAAHKRVGDMLVAQGALDAGLTAYRTAYAISQALVTRDPGDLEAQHNLAANHNTIGDVQELQEDLTGALTSYRAAQVIAEMLAAAEPDRVSRVFDLSICHDNIAGVLLAQGDLTGALTAYRAGLAIAERLAAHDPENTSWQRGVSIGHLNIGDVLREQKDLDGALAAYQAARAIRARLTARDPSNLEWQQDVTIGLERVAGIHLARGAFDDALVAFRESLAIRERLLAQDPTNADWGRNVWIGHYKIGTVAELRGDVSGARASYAVALAGAERWLLAYPDVPEHVSDVAELRAWVARCCPPPER